MSPAPVLTERALQQLLKNNHTNFVSVRVGEGIVYRIHRSVAKRFSPVWRSALQDPSCTTVTVTLPPNPPAAPHVSQPGSSSDSAEATAPSIPPVPRSELERKALKFVVQWMEKGGADPHGDNAVPYPKLRPGLELLLALAETLQVKELADRLSRDLGRISAPRPKKCTKCKKLEHPGQECFRCFHCNELGHRKAECAKAFAEFLEREQRRQERAAREKERKEREEVARRRAEEESERWSERWRQRMIRSGQMAVGENGKTIMRWT